MNLKSNFMLNCWHTVYWEFFAWEILVKMMLARCVEFSLSPIFAISRTLNKDV